MVRPCLAAAALLTCIALSPRAKAEDVSPSSEAPSAAAASKAEAEAAPSPQQYKTKWYGYQTLIVDGVAIVTAPVLVGVGIYAVGAPVVHLANGQPGRAAGSLGLRVGMPLVLGLAGAGIGHRDCTGDLGEQCGFGEAVMIAAGVLVGALSAIVIDAAALAYRKVPVVPSPRPSASYAPNLLVGRDRAMVTVGGTF